MVERIRCRITFIYVLYQELGDEILGLVRNALKCFVLEVVLTSEDILDDFLVAVSRKRNFTRE